MRDLVSVRILPLLLAAGLALSGCAVLSPAADEGAEPRAEQPLPDETTTEDARPPVPPLHPSVDGYPEAWVTLVGADDGEITLPVKHADTQMRRAHGLMEVPELPEGTGMLFTFDEDRTGGFWMKGTLVELDIAFADEDGEIVAILAMDPCEEDPCEVYEPGATYRAALEVPQGWFAAQGIEVGDRFHFERADGT